MNNYEIGSLTKMMAMSNCFASTDEDKASMNLGFTIYLNGTLDKKRLERSIQKLINEKIMHTTLSLDEMNIIAHEKEDYSFVLAESEAEGDTAEEKLAYVKKESEKITFRPLPLFDAEKEGYVFHLYRISEEYHVLLMIVHHTFLDFGAVMIAMNHIFGAYNDDNYKYPESKEFSEFMKEELEFWNSADGTAEDKFWESETADVIQPPLEKDILTGNEPLIEEKDLVSVFSRAEIDSIAKAQKTSSFNIIMLLIQMAIAKTNNCNDTLLQFAISNRSEMDTRYTLGCLTRLLSNRIKFDDSMNVSDLNKIMRKKMGAAYQNRHVAGKTPLGSVPYVVANEDMGDLEIFPMFNGKPVHFDFVDMPRTVDFIAYLIVPLDAENISISEVTDMTKYAYHAKSISDNIKLAKEFMVNYPKKTFEDFMRSDITLETLDLLDDDSIEIIEI